MRSIYRMFKKHFHLCRDIYKKMDKTGSFTVRAHFTTDDAEAELEGPDDDLTMRFIVVMRRFLDPKDSLYYKTIWAELQQQFGAAIPDERKVEIDAFIERLNEGHIPVNVNGEHLTAERIYEIIADGERFGRDEKLSEYLRGLADVPMLGPFLWHQFYEYTIGTLMLASKLFDVISLVERTAEYKGLYGDPVDIVNHCIYCLTSEGAFTSEEHLVPEGLGNYDVTLPAGFTCDSCNNGVLALLDREAQESSLFAFQRVHAVSYTKKGKFPETRFTNATLKKTDPLNVTLTADPNSDAVKIVKEHDDGTVEFSVHLTHPKPFEPRLLARWLCKIGLGMVAMDFGHEYACSSRFDATRRFITSGGEFPNNLILLTDLTPRTDITSRYNHTPDVEGTLAWFNILGVSIGINLEERPFLRLDPTMKALGFVAFSLYGNDDYPPFEMHMRQPKEVDQKNQKDKQPVKFEGDSNVA